MYWKYTICSVFPLKEIVFVHMFQNVHNFVIRLVQFLAQTVFNCEARRFDPFVG